MLPESGTQAQKYTLVIDIFPINIDLFPVTLYNIDTFKGEESAVSVKYGSRKRCCH